MQWCSHVGNFFCVPAHVQNSLGIVVWSSLWLICPRDSYSWPFGFLVSTQFSMWGFPGVLALPKVPHRVLLLSWDSPLNIGPEWWSVYWAHAYLYIFPSLELGLPFSSCEDTLWVLGPHHGQYGRSPLDTGHALCIGFPWGQHMGDLLSTRPALTGNVLLTHDYIGNLYWRAVCFQSSGCWTCPGGHLHVGF